MESSRQLQSNMVSGGGQFELLQHCSSTTESTVTGSGGDGTIETPTGTTAESSTTSVHAIFNLDTGKVMDAIKETRELLEGGVICYSDKSKIQTPTDNAKKTKRKGKKQKKKVSATWTAEWSEEHFKNEPKSSANGKM